MFVLSTVGVCTRSNAFVDQKRCSGFENALKKLYFFLSECVMRADYLENTQGHVIYLCPSRLHATIGRADRLHIDGNFGSRVFFNSPRAVRIGGKNAYRVELGLPS